MRVLPTCFILLIVIHCGGCSILSHRGESTEAGSGVGSLLGSLDAFDGKAAGTIANPPARSIRFDGHEVLLGSSSGPNLSIAQFDQRLDELLAQEKRYTARSWIERHQSIAEQLLWTLSGQPRHRQKVQLIAEVLSVGVDPAVSWNGWLAQAAMNSKEANAYHALRNSFAERLRTQQPTQDECERLRSAAQVARHPLATIDALHLFGVRELVAGRHAWAESLFLQAAEVAEQNRDYQRSASAWSMCVLTAQASGDASKGERAWLTSVEQQLRYEQGSSAHYSLHPFWARAEELRPAQSQWPTAVAGALSRFGTEVDCPLSAKSPAELVVHAALGSAAYASDQPQVALVNFKQAELFAAPEDVMWLRISQARCLAILGQAQTATALLSAPVAHKNRTIATAAMATIGSIKLQTGAYQQGAQLLHKALSESDAAWPSRSRSEADLALATLIIGDSDAGLVRLEAAQAKFAAEGNTTALLRSLENQLDLYNHEQRTAEAERVQDAIHDLESTAS